MSQRAIGVWRVGMFVAAGSLSLVAAGADAQTAPSPRPPVAETPASPPPAQPAASPTPDAANAAAFDAQVAALIGRPGGLTSDQAAREGARTSFDVQAHQAEIRVAAAAVEQAVVAYFPRLSLLARYARLSPITPPTLGEIVVPAPGTTVPPGETLPAGTPLVAYPLTFPVPEDDVRFSAALTVPLSDYLLRTSQAYAAATHSRRAAELSETAARSLAALGGRIAYYNWVRATLSVLVAQQALEQSRAHRIDVGHMFEAGAVSQADVMRVESQVASAALLVARAENLALVTEDQLRTAMHAPPETVFAIGEDIRADPPAVDRADNFAQLFDEAMQHRPELLALSETIGSLHEQARVARAGYFPRLDAFGDVLTANPNPRYFPPTSVFNTTWEVGAQLTWAPNDLGLAIAQVHAADARTAQAAAQRGALRDQLRTEVMQAFTGLREALVAVQTTATGLAAAEESYRVRRVLFRNGRATSVELTDAETDLTRVRLEALNAHIDLRIARARLLHATGRDIETLPH